jgi:hypothetical protein
VVAAATVVVVGGDTCGGCGNIAVCFKNKIEEQ